MSLWCLPHTDLQRELISNALPGSGPVASVQFSEEKQSQRIQQRTGACVYNKHMLQSDERSTQHHVIPAPFTTFHFIPDNQVPQLQAPNSPVTSDVFQLAPFKPPEKQSKKAFGSSSFSASHKPVEASDVFLQAPFGKRQEATKANAHIFKSVTQQMQSSKHSPQAPLCATQPLAVRAPHQPLLQQPVAVHRVVSRIGQQAAVGSVAVGPLHSWTIGGRALDDPFTAAPFQPRCSQGKP